MDIALKFRLGRMTDEAAVNRLRELARKEMLANGEREEAWALGDRLGVPVVVQRLELAIGAEWQTAEREAA